MKVVRCQPYAPAAFTPRINLVLILEADSNPGHMELSDATEKTPATPGIDPETFRLVAQCLNHYATPGPTLVARSIVNSYTESGRKQIHWCVFRGEICELVTEFHPEISNSCSLYDSVRGHAFCKLGKCVKSTFRSWSSHTWSLSSKDLMWLKRLWTKLSLPYPFGGRTETLGGPRVEGTWSVRFWGSTPFGSPVELCEPPGLIFSNSTFCPHSVFMCFVFIWEPTAIFPFTGVTDWFL
jgi:hypothetical protein